MYKSAQIFEQWKRYAFSSPSFVGTSNFMLVACLVGTENKFKLGYLSPKTPQQQMSPLH